MVNQSELAELAKTKTEVGEFMDELGGPSGRSWVKSERESDIEILLEKSEEVEVDLIRGIYVDEHGDSLIAFWRPWDVAQREVDEIIRVIGIGVTLQYGLDEADKLLKSWEIEATRVELGEMGEFDKKGW